MIVVEFIVYGVGGKSMLVDSEVGKQFRMNFEGISISGKIEVNEKEFEDAADRLKSRFEEFKSIDRVEVRSFVFRGKVNGKYEVLPAEPLEAFTKRFIENHVFILKF